MQSFIFYFIFVPYLFIVIHFLLIFFCLSFKYYLYYTCYANSFLIGCFLFISCFSIGYVFKAVACHFAWKEKIKSSKICSVSYNRDHTFTPNCHFAFHKKTKWWYRYLMREMNNFSCHNCATIAAFKSYLFHMSAFEHLFQITWIWFF